MTSNMHSQVRKPCTAVCNLKWAPQINFASYVITIGIEISLQMFCLCAEQYHDIAMMEKVYHGYITIWFPLISIVKVLHNIYIHNKHVAI